MYLNGNRVTNCRWTLRCIRLRLLGVRVVRGSWIWTFYYPLTLKIGTCKVFFAKTLNRIELPTVDPGWSCRQGSGLLLLTADVEKIAELALFQVVLFKPLWCVRQTEDDSFPYSFRKIYCYWKPGSETRKPCSRYALLPEAWFRDLISWSRYMYCRCL